MKHTLAALLLVTIALPISYASAQDYKTDRGNGVITYGTPFKVQNGYSLYETEGAPVAVSENGGVFALGKNNEILYDKVLNRPTSVSGTFSNQETARAKSYYSKYGTTDGSSFEEAFNNQTIRGYSASLDTPRYEASTSPTVNDSAAAGGGGSFSNQETARAKSYYSKYGTTDGSSFEEAFNNQTIRGYSASLDTPRYEASTSPTVNDSAAAGGGGSFSNQETARAKSYYSKYGTTDGSSFEEAFNNQTIRGYSASLDTPRYEASTSPTIGNSYNEPVKRMFNGIETVGEPFKTTSDGTRYFETEGQPVAITANNGVYGITGGGIDYSKPLSQSSRETASKSKDSILRKFGFLSKDTNTNSASSSGDSKPTIKPFSFTNFLNGSSAGENTASGNYVSKRTSGQLEGFALALTPEEVRQRRSAYSKKYNNEKNMQ